MGNEALSALKNDIGRWMEKCEVMLSELRKHIDPITKQASELANEVRAIKGKLETLKLEELRARPVSKQSRTTMCGIVDRKKTQIQP